jgi:hypothetical protein
MISTAVALRPQFEVRFDSLFRPGRGFVFPCDEEGHVDIGALSERGRANYLSALDLLGSDFATPRVVRAAGQAHHA